MRTFTAGFIMGLFISGLLFVLIFHLLDPKPKPPADVKITQVSGEKIDHKDFDYGKHSITFTTIAQGAGVITTEIPKVNVPEARAWVEDTNGVMLELLLAEQRMYGVSYMKRWNNIVVGGGVLVSEKKFEGVKVQTEYWFSL